MKPYAIYCWTGKELTDHGTFETYEDAWDYIYTHWNDEEDYQDLYVLERSHFEQHGFN